MCIRLQRCVHSQGSFRFQTSIALLLFRPLISKSRVAKPYFQISGSVSDFRLAQGREIEIGSSISDFRFRTRTRERNRNREFHFNFRFRFQKSVLRETKSNLEMISGFHFDFSTELSITPAITSGHTTDYEGPSAHEHV